ncbi:TetR/AcrR family transcriptional regulator [Nocardioides bruguierae]|uniref:TetR/AcrR family transcriptional regulator n=1 Tax=Nocardioides bruguierae TaxID=2945102 RepID=A0A9X2D8N3_9ACTN|nr:TetR/AcrR family transcriptional regulator [Nocardioides bruguierae]MCM0621388.1 TetR/AcrR family transcriptional regulator [Nocardioides bruguierae]
MSGSSPVTRRFPGQDAGEDAAGTGADAAGRRGRGYSKGRAARSRILRVATEAFAERGYRGASLAEIARASELSMPGLLHHFANKDQLFAAVHEHLEIADQRLFDGFAGEDPSGFGVLDAFVSMARMNLDRWEYVQFTHLIAAESAPGGHPGAHTSREHFRAARQLLVEGFTRSLAQGEIRTGVDLDRLAVEVVAMVEGLQNQWLQEPEAIAYAEHFATWVEDLKASLRP